MFVDSNSHGQKSQILSPHSKHVAINRAEGETGRQQNDRHSYYKPQQRCSVCCHINTPHKTLTSGSAWDLTILSASRNTRFLIIKLGSHLSLLFVFTEWKDFDLNTLRAEIQRDLETGQLYHLINETFTFNNWWLSLNSIYYINNSLEKKDLILNFFLWTIDEDLSCPIIKVL